jgi:predicted thioesterase
VADSRHSGEGRMGIQAVTFFLDWPEEQTVGTHIKVSHLAATPPVLEVTVTVRLLEVDGDDCYLRWKPMMALISSLAANLNV